MSRLQNDAERRIFETLQFLFDVMDEGGLDPNGKGVESAQRVRLMHAGIRHLMRTKSSAFQPGDRAVVVGAVGGLPVRPHPGTHVPATTSLPNGTEVTVVGGPTTVNGFTFWELDADQPSGPVSGWGEARHLLGNFARNGEVHWHAEWGACINQEHMLGTILVMSVHVVDCLQKQWVKLSPEDQWAYVYTWLHVGRIMGVKEDLIPRDLQQAKDLWGLIRRRQYDYSEATRPPAGAGQGRGAAVSSLFRAVRPPGVCLQAQRS